MLRLTSINDQSHVGVNNLSNVRCSDLMRTGVARGCKSASPNCPITPPSPPRYPLHPMISPSTLLIGFSTPGLLLCHHILISLKVAVVAAWQGGSPPSIPAPGLLAAHAISVHPDSALTGPYSCLVALCLPCLLSPTSSVLEPGRG